jgi:hypothetical protein
MQAREVAPTQYTTIHTQYVIPTHISPQVVPVKVISSTNDTATQMAPPQHFQLNPAQKKAVVQTGGTLTRIDKSYIDRVKDTVGQPKVYMIPEIYYAKVKGTDEQVSYRILFIDSAPLKYNFEKNIFEGSIRILPVEERGSESNQAGQKQLSVPEEIFISYGSTSIPLNITQVNWPPLDVKVTSPDPQDSVEIRVLTQSQPLGYPKNLRVEPAIFLSSTRTTIQGFGIQTLPVHVALKGVSTYKPIPVSIETSLGTIDSANFYLTGDKPHEVILRSESTGKINLKVVNTNFQSNSISVEAVFPWMFLILAILGGLIGGIGKNLFNKEKITGSSIALGSIIGLIAAVAYWGLGIVLIGFSIKTQGINEAMVFGFGLLAGYFGLLILKNVAGPKD